MCLSFYLNLVTVFFSRFQNQHEKDRLGDKDKDREQLSLTALEEITDALLEILEACMSDIPDCEWLQTWTTLARKFAFSYNPALQPRALIVLGCISMIFAAVSQTVFMTNCFRQKYLRS